MLHIFDLVREETGGCDNCVLDGEEDLIAACVTPTLVAGDKGEEACKGNLLLATGEAMNNQLHSVYCNDTGLVLIIKCSEENDNNVVSHLQISSCSM